MKIRAGDTVVVISGKDKGKTGVIAEARPAEERVVIDGVNVVKKHRRATRAGGKGQIIDIAMPLHVSNVMLIDPKTGSRTRVGYKKEGGKRERIAKKSGSVIA